MTPVPGMGQLPRKEVVVVLADYIVGFYNCTRLRSKLGNLSPNALK